MNVHSKTFWLSLLALVLCVNLIIGFNVYSHEAEKTGESEAFEKVGIMMQVLHLIRQDYVNATKVSYTDLLYNAMRGMAGALDPFSSFLSPDEYQDMMEITEGQFGGLGITITVRNGLLTVVAPIEGSPAGKAGILTGDQIVKIAGKLTRDMNLNDAVNQLKGEPGSKIEITVYRPATQQNLDFTLVRAIINVPTITQVQVFEGQVGYLRLTEFSEPTAAKLEETLEELIKKNIQSLIIDLRNNPGGLLDSAVEVCSYFLPPKQLVVFTEGRRPSQKQEFFTDTRSKFPTALPLAFLVNGGSASAAEIVSGCLQDWGRAILIGEKTFGKGSVQNLIELADGSALRLTTAMYYTPSRRIIHEHGIEPDITVTLSDEEQQQMRDEENDAGGDSKPNPNTDRQLMRALEIMKSYDAFRQARQARFKTLKTTPLAAAGPEPPAAAPQHQAVPEPAPAPAP